VRPSRWLKAWLLCTMACRFASAHSLRLSASGRSERPRSVSAYSTRRGRSSYRRRVTRPSRSRLRRVCESIFCETPSSRRIRPPNRMGPSASATIAIRLHFSPMRARTWRDGQTATKASGTGSCTMSGIVTFRYLIDAGNHLFLPCHWRRPQGRQAWTSVSSAAATLAAGSPVF